MRSMSDVRRRAMVVLVLASAATSTGCILAIPVGGAAALSVRPGASAAFILAESVSVGTPVRWRNEASGERYDRRGATLKAIRGGIWTIARPTLPDTTLTLAPTLRLEVSLAKQASRTRAFWHPILWGTVGYAVGAVVGSAAGTHPSGDLSETQLGGMLVGGVIGLIYGTSSGLRPVPQWTEVRYSGR